MGKCLSCKKECVAWLISHCRASAACPGSLG